MKSIFAVLTLFAVVQCSAWADAPRAELGALLDHFLANAADPAVHEAFWAEDLVYTSSAGARFGKGEILAGMSDAEQTGEPATRYHAEDTRIRLLGDGRVAVVTFRLVGETQTESGPEVRHYFNTGVFTRSGGRWQAVTWQATRADK